MDGNEMTGSLGVTVCLLQTSVTSSGSAHHEVYLLQPVKLGFRRWGNQNAFTGNKKVGTVLCAGEFSGILNTSIRNCD